MTHSNGGVSALLADKYGLCVELGRKTECPFCHHKTLSVKRDDTLAKCFHPGCGRFVTPFSTEHERRIGRVLDEVFRDWHARLLKDRKKQGETAYNFCVQERNLHPRVVADSWVGVVPEGFDVAGKFAPEIRQLQTEIRDLAKSGPKDKGHQKKQEALEVKLAEVEAAQQKLQDYCKWYSGWLAFFYTDAQGRVTAIRFREPYSKKIRMFKPTSAMGLFNAQLFRPGTEPGTTTLNGHLIVTEGEFNTLQLQSLVARNHEFKGLAPQVGYAFSCAVGGVNNADIEAIRRIATNPIICYDNDASGSGFALVEAARQQMNVEAFTTPEVNSDLDSFISAFGNDIEAAYEGAQRLLGGHKPFYRHYSALKTGVDNVRRSEGRGGLKPFEVAREAAAIIIADLEQRGKLYHDGHTAYLFLNEDKRLIPIERDEVQLELLLQKYGVAPSDSVARCVLDALRLAALERGKQTEVHPFSYYNRETNVLYLFNLGSKVYRITADGYQTVDNGTDGVLFVSNPNWKAFEVGEQTQQSALDEHLLRPMRFQGNGALSADDMELLLLMWFYSLFFPQLFPTKVILAFIGERGSGKTTAARRIGQIVFGPKFNVMPLSNDEKDFDAAITSCPLVAIDNSDTPIKWLEDKMAIAATGGSIKRRELYTTNSLVEYPIRAAIMVTSRTPPFRREDVADRLLLLKMARFEEFAPESGLMADLHANRDAIMTEVVGQLQDVLRALEQSAGKTYKTPFRMADFSGFCMKIADAPFVKALAGEDSGKRMVSIFEKLREEQTAFAIEGEPLCDLIELWVTQDKGDNVGRWITTTELWKELAEVAHQHHIVFSYSSARSLGKRLTNLASPLRARFQMREKTERGNKRVLSFVPPEEPPAFGPESVQEYERAVAG
jgi:hypothetical protein